MAQIQLYMQSSDVLDCHNLNTNEREQEDLSIKNRKLSFKYPTPPKK